MIPSSEFWTPIYVGGSIHGFTGLLAARGARAHASNGQRFVSTTYGLYPPCARHACIITCMNAGAEGAGYPTN